MRVHRLERGAGLSDPVHQKVRLFEIGQELFAKKRDGNSREREDNGYDDTPPSAAC